MSDGLDRLGAALSDRYWLERELGQGGMATVYLAEDLKHHRKVALKVLRPELAASLGTERFLREITIAAALQHPHILGLHDSGVAEGFLYYVMPYIEGPSLRQKLAREGEQPIGETVRILRDLADALAYAHSRGVVHRDIKPENLLLSGRHALVSDFGVAKAVSEATGQRSVTTAGVALGTPAYMAPEQAAADPHTDHRADIYAFGVVAYELLTGQPPFTASTPQAILAAQVTEAPEAVNRRRAAIPAPLVALVMHCLEKKPADRPQTAEELVSRLETAITPSGGVTPIRLAGRSGVRALGLGVLVAAGLGFAMWKKPALTPTAPPASQIKSIAVLPLVNVGGDSAQDYYADGLSEELANALGKVRGLQVAARTSTFAFKGRRDIDVKEVSDRLNVGMVLQGTVRRFGERLRLGVQLIDARRGVELWSESYDQMATEVFAIQDSITRAIVRQLALTLGAAGRKGTTPDLEAHDLYLRGLSLVNQSVGEQDFREGLAYFRRALERDPDYVDAWLGIAFAYVGLADAFLPGRAAYDSSAMAAHEALARDSLAGEAFAFLALGSPLANWDAVELDFRRAVSQSPNSSFAHSQYGVLLCGIGRIEEGLRLLDRAQALDRLSFFVGLYREYCLYSARRYADVIAAHDQNAALGQEQILLDDLKAAATREQGRYEEALKLYEHAQTLSPQPLFGYAITYARMGRTKEARDILARLMKYAQGHYVNPLLIAFVHASLGEYDLTFEWLDRAVKDGTALLTGLKTWPELEPIRSDQRYVALLKRLGW